jgi:fructokinase
VLILFDAAKLDNIDFEYQYLHNGGAQPAIRMRLVVVGEVLWDRFPDFARLGGAPLNVAVHLKRLRHDPLLVSAVGTDAPGEEAKKAITAFGLDTTLLQSSDRHPTGYATVRIEVDGDTSFVIERPAAYDAVRLSDESLRQIARWNPGWLYYGTLFASSAPARAVLHQLLNALPNAARFYDVNLRPGFESPELVRELLRTADVVKLNERELRFVRELLELPADPEGFCRAGSDRYQWRAVCVTLGAGGCAMLVNGDYADAPGLQVDVADTVGAGDAFAAAFVHGLVSNWPAARIASFSNRMGAMVAASPGAIPDWTHEDAIHP